MQATDWPGVARIYQEGIETGIATFETTVPAYGAWDAGHLPFCRFVACKSGQIIGWAALSPVSGRCVYGGVAEVSIYVGEEARGRGLGVRLMRELIRESEQQGLWTLQSGIFPENQASIRLHERTGFRKLGVREKIGKRDGKWKDNLVFERRSRVVGVDSPAP